MLFKCVGVTLAVLAVPLVLGTVAALQDPPEGPAGAFFARFFLYLFQEMGLSFLFYQVFNAIPRKRILERYRQEGIDFVGTVTKDCTTIYWTFVCINTRKSQTIEYVYRVLDDNGEQQMYKKLKRNYYFCCSQPWKATARNSSGLRTIPLKRIPLLDGSGYPTHLVQKELRCYWLGILLCVLSGVWLAIIAPAAFADGPDSPVGIAIGSAWNLAVGICLAWTGHRNWQRQTLMDGKVPAKGTNASNDEYPMPEAVAVPVTGDDETMSKDDTDDRDDGKMIV